MNAKKSMQKINKTWGRPGAPAARLTERNGGLPSRMVKRLYPAEAYVAVASGHDIEVWGRSLHLHYTGLASAAGMLIE
jgi:hypothetical protein